jgi:class 3 adenylate cyclase
VQMRLGLNSGEVVVRAIGNDLHMDYSAVGLTTVLAARLEQLATPASARNAVIRRMPCASSARSRRDASLWSKSKPKSTTARPSP